MIQKDCFTSAWIDIVSKQLKYNDKNLIEKVIRALSLLEIRILCICLLFSDKYGILKKTKEK